MYRIAVLSDNTDMGPKLVEQTTRICSEYGLFPRIRLHFDQEAFFNNIQSEAPTHMILALSGVAGLNAAEHLRSLLPDCGLIWCSDLDFSLHAFRLRAEYFMLAPAAEHDLREGLSVWMKRYHHQQSTCWQSSDH